MKLKHFLWMGLLALVVGLCVAGCSQTVTKNFGGTTTIDLDPGRKLEMITWKDDNMWIQTRERREGEKPEQHVFKEQSALGAWQGTVIINER